MQIRTISAFAALFLVSCAQSRSDATFFESDALGVRIDRFRWADAKRLADTDGADVYEVAGRVRIRGKGERDVVVRDEVEPAALGGTHRLTVTDAATRQARTFTYDPRTSSVQIADGTAATTVVQQPDGSYSVDGVAASGAREAVALLNRSPVYAKASAFDVTMAYAVAQAPRGRSGLRSPICCVNCSGPNVSVPPEQLYGCAVCDKLGAESCPLCPETLDKGGRRHDVKRDVDGTVRVKRSRQGKFKQLAMRKDGGEVTIGTTTLSFTYPQDGSNTVIIDGTVCRDQNDVIEVLERKNIVVPVAEIDEFISEINDKNIDFKFKGRNKAFRDFLMEWRKKLASK